MYAKYFVSCRVPRTILSIMRLSNKQPSLGPKSYKENFLRKITPLVLSILMVEIVLVTNQIAWNKRRVN